MTEPARSPGVAWYRRLPIDTEAAFALIFLAALAAAVIAPAIANYRLEPYVHPAAVAIILAAGFAWRPVAGLLAFAVFVLVYETVAVYVGGSVKRADELAIPLLVLIGLVRYRPWRTWEWSWLRDGGLALFVVAGLASSLLNEVPLAIWPIAFALLVKPIVAFYLAMWVQPDRREMLGVARVLLVVGVVVAVPAVAIEAFGQAAFQQALGLPDYVRPRGTLPSIKSIFTHPAVFAWFMSFLALYTLIGYVHLRRRWLLALGFLFSVATFMAARRRVISAALGSLLATFAWSVRRPSRLMEETRRWVPVFAVTALVVVAFIPGLLGLYQRTVDRLDPGTDSGEIPGEVVDDEAPGTAPARIALYQGAVAIARDNFPLGGGMGRYASWMSRVEYSPLYEEYDLSDIRGLREDASMFATDTFWPMILGETGVLGTVGYVAFLSGIGLAIWRAGRADLDPFARTFIVGALAVLLAAGIESLAAPMFTSPARSYLLFAALGGSLAFARSVASARSAGASGSG
jgi:hypothetical protein